MSATTSATTGRRYGLERVCRMWERSRSALYARRARVQRPARGARPARRGPTPALSDAQLLAAIRSDLARSPFQGEGHRKVHARLRILDDIRVSRTRVLRVMRAQGLLSPHRGRQGEMKVHEGDHCHLGARRHVGYRWRAGVHGGRRLGLDLRGRRPLERRVRGLACVQGGEPLCGSRAGRARAPATLRLGRGRRGPRAGAADGSRQPVSVGPTSSTSSATGASTPASASSKSRKPTGSSSAGIARSRSKPSTAGSFETSPRCAPPSLRSSNATTSAGASKSWRIARHSKRASNTSDAMPRSANVCPRNRVRYNLGRSGPDPRHLQAGQIPGRDPAAHRAAPARLRAGPHETARRRSWPCCGRWRADRRVRTLTRRHPAVSADVSRQHPGPNAINLRRLSAKTFFRQRDAAKAGVHSRALRRLV